MNPPEGRVLNRLSPATRGAYLTFESFQAIMVRGGGLSHWCKMLGQFIFWAGHTERYDDPEAVALRNLGFSTERLAREIQYYEGTPIK